MNNTTTLNGTLETIKLTKLETEVLGALFNSASGNGHDFGFGSEHGLENKRSGSGIVSSLVKKGLLSIHRGDSGCGILPQYLNQFTWNHDVEQVNALLLKWRGVYADLDARMESGIKASMEAQFGETLSAEKTKAAAVISKASQDAESECRRLQGLLDVATSRIAELEATLLRVRAALGG